ncbi:hypothetical protein AQ808_23975 [Burkholderia pseudomallei]|uniref:hypothetical protein n=1 Tax=Burkholderia pseudomallei TaxID=28450 RepID=UPI0009CFE346|nr:hypothetical protein [Burkholderia pseudomallei]OMW45735.1 hypothetical protein AQ808_23975 [Burkholderia pseudomallei]
MNDQQQSRADALTDDRRDAIDYAIQVLRQVETGDGTFVGQCADAISGLAGILAAFPGEHPAAAPIVSAPADERAAFDSEVGNIIADAATRGIAWMAFKAGARYARAAASPAAERVTAALQALSADVHTLGDGWANDEAMIGLAKKYLRVEPKPASPELSLWRDFVLLAVTDAAPQPAQADAPAHAAECPHCEGEGVIEGDSGTSPCACQRDAQEGMPTFGARRAQADAPAEAFPYQKTFNAIAAATSVEGGHVSISVKAFRDAFGGAVAEAREPIETEQSIAADCYHWIAERIGTKDGYSVQEHVDAMCQVIDECADFFHDFVGADEGGNDEAVRIAKNIRALKAGTLQDVSAPADAGEAREPIGPHDLSTTAGGRSYVAEFFAKRLRRHDFGRYITGQLAADFACSLAAYLRDHDHAAADAGEAQPYAYVAPVSNYATRNKIVADRIGGLIPVYTAQPAARVASLTDAARDMLAERRRQVEAEGWTPKHDDEHDKGEMARAAACYALHAGSCFAWRADAYQSAKPHEGNPAAQNSLWPWDMKWWKPKDPRRDLVRAGALILAELERLDRATLLNGADKS